MALTLQFLPMNKSYRFCLSLFILLLIVSSCQNETPPSIRIAVSANAEPLATALMREFDADPPLVTELMLGSSGQLSAQIANGAPVDIFLAADTTYPDYLYGEGLGKKPPRVYAEGVLVIMSTDTVPNLGLLETERIKNIVIANPELAPYGKASKEYLQNTGKWQGLEDKFVYAENALQAAMFTNTKAADIGFGALSIAMNLSKKTKLYYTAVDSDKYNPIRQAALLLKRDSQQPQVEAFYNFIFSEKGREVIAQYGYKLTD